MTGCDEPALDLAALQRGLRDLIKDRPVSTAGADPYLAAVAASGGLAVVREIVLFWRALAIERACVLTAAVLKRRGRFDEVVADFVRGHAISPYVDELGPRFLKAVGSDDDALVAAVARFELALVLVKRGDPAPHVIDWAHEPYAILQALIGGRPLDEKQAAGRYRTVVSRDMPQLFRVTAVS